MKIHRLMAILLILDSKGKIKAKELADSLEVSVRTIYRDIDTLAEIGIPITTTTGPNGGIHIMDGYSVDLNNLLGDEVIDLYLSSKGIHPDKQSNTGLKVENAILKFEKNISSKHNDDLQKVQERFYFDREPWWGERAEVPCLDTLIKSTWQTSKIEIKYRKVDGNISSRIIRPYGIVVKRMDWYLIGYCEKSQNMRTFKCERILESIIIDSTFSIPDNFSLENYWQKSQGLFKRNCEEKEKYPVKIKVNKTYMQILEKFEVFTLDHRGGFVIASVNMHKYDFACTEVKEIIGLVEVMEPEEIRLYARKELNKLVKKYTDIEK